MTQEAAIYEARKRIAEKNLEGLYIVYSRELFDAPGHHYHVATEKDLRELYLGCTIAAYVDERQEVQFHLGGDAC